VLGFLESFGVTASRREGLPGVWTDNRKICSIGVAFSRWVSFHGLSVNIRSADMQPYSLIRPCGMNIKMTCLEEEAPRARELAYSALLEGMQKSFLKVFWPLGIRIEENGKWA
jgi:lipoate-protein ligase B